MKINYSKGMIIGVCGLIGGGKGTVADILVGSHNFHKISFADALKDAVSRVFSWDRKLLEGDTKQSREWREEVDQWWAVRLDIPNLTPRWVLQYWGTEVCRVGFHEDIWVASMERRVMNLQASHPTTNYVIPDTRFPNEVDMIRRQGGKVWGVRRGEDPGWMVNLLLHGTEPNDVHPSEWSWVRSNLDQLIDNNGTLHDLEEKVKTLL
jgi:hypothetical protein